MSSTATSTPNLGPTQTKYGERNPIARLANRIFLRTVVKLLSSIEYRTLLDAGSGEGVVLRQAGVLPRAPGLAVALDVDPARIEHAARDVPQVRAIVASLYALPFRADSFEAVLSLEVLEHLSDPALALREIRRVTSRYLLASVPNEPWWRIANMIRLKYLREFGNTPEHVQNWTVFGFRRLISGHFAVLRMRLAFLWTFILGEKHRRS